MWPKRILLFVVPALVTLAGATPALADHLVASPVVKRDVGNCNSQGQCSVTVSWDVNCPGGQRFAWQVVLVKADVPFDPSIFGNSVPVKYEHFVSGEGFGQVASGSKTVQVEPGLSLYPGIEASCELADTTHASPKAYAREDAFDTPPFLKPPDVTVLGGGPGGGGTGPTDPDNVPPHRRISLNMVFAEIAPPNDVLAINLHGAGVNIVRRRTAGKLAARKRDLVFDTKRRGKIRCFVGLEGARSNVVKLRVR